MLKQCIDATKYETRVTKTGENIEPLPADAGLIDGWPIDRPDERSGWLLVDVFVVASDEYHALWARPRGKLKVKRKKKAKPTPQAEAISDTAPAPAAPTPTPTRTRKPKPAPRKKVKKPNAVAAAEPPTAVEPETTTN